MYYRCLTLNPTPIQEAIPGRMQNIKAKITQLTIAMTSRQGSITAIHSCWCITSLHSIFTAAVNHGCQSKFPQISSITIFETFFSFNNLQLLQCLNFFCCTNDVTTTHRHELLCLLFYDVLQSAVIGLIKIHNPLTLYSEYHKVSKLI